MKRLLLAATALLTISTAPAFAYELNCGAPRQYVGDGKPDRNPVISINIQYDQPARQWQVFHRLADGTVVSRSAQYGMNDATDGNRAQWQGVWNKNKAITMIGELDRANDGNVLYTEFQYDRTKNDQMVMRATAKCAFVTAQAPAAPVYAPQQPAPYNAQAYAPATQPVYQQREPEMVFYIPDDVPAGHMNMRRGPGTNFSLLGSIPAGMTVRAQRCAPREDGLAGADWCLVSFNGNAGWVSRAGLMPLASE